METGQEYTDNRKRVGVLWDLLDQVMDPEVPVLSVVDLGIVRNIEIRDDSEVIASTTITTALTGAGTQSVTVTITPTYSGCPAMEVIGREIRNALLQYGFREIEIKTVLSPAWTTDWMSEKGKDQLRAFGIAAPLPSQSVCHTRLFHEEEAVPCPRCQSYDTRLVSWFGSTPCKSLYRCLHCQEPFDYFKCH